MRFSLNSFKFITGVVSVAMLLATSGPFGRSVSTSCTTGCPVAFCLKVFCLKKASEGGY